MHSQTCMVPLGNLHGWTSQLAWFRSPKCMVGLPEVHGSASAVAWLDLKTAIYRPKMTRPPCASSRRLSAHALNHPCPPLRCQSRQPNQRYNPSRHTAAVPSSAPGIFATSRDNILCNTYQHSGLRVLNPYAKCGRNGASGHTLNPAFRANSAALDANVLRS